MKIKTEITVPAGMYCNGCKHTGKKYTDCLTCNIYGYACFYASDGTARTVKCDKCLLACAAELRK
jgi:hypothetical protein